MVRSTVRRLGLLLTGVLMAGTALASPAHAATVTATPVATGLAVPTAFTFAPDGRIFYGERFTGQIRILNPANGSNSLFFTVPNVATAGEQGLLGIALDPGYPSKPNVFAYVTRTVSGVTENEIIRLRDSNGTGSGMKIIYRAPANSNHNGGRILFGPDKKLYAVVGEAGVPANAQNLNETRGKVLRMTPGGAVPSGNPFGTLVWAYGIRNSFGFTFDPQTRRLWETENGPECNDELNLVVKGGNFGWGPAEKCSSPPPAPVNTNQDGPNPILPLTFYTPTVAPTGAAFCAGCGLGSASEGHLFYGTNNTHQLREVTLNGARTGVAAETLAYTHSSAIFSVERGPDGTLYFSDASGIYKVSAP
jgi:glucose/arabinose dehydrogenase